MEWQFEVFRRKRTDWTITWQENKIRWIIFYYIVGLIVSCLLMFVEESLFPLPWRYLIKSLILTVFIPVLTVLMSVALQYRRNPFQGRNG
jgi:hypothetical protein